MADAATHRARLIKRLRYLWTFELFNSFFLPGVLAWVASAGDQQLGLFVFYSVGVTVLLLWQGAGWWWLTLRSVRVGTPVSERVLRYYGFFKRANWLLLALLPVALAVDILIVGRFGLFDLLAGGAFYGLAVLEQINYYYYQLMYDNLADLRWLAQHKRLKRANLARALDRISSA